MTMFLQATQAQSFSPLVKCATLLRINLLVFAKGQMWWLEAEHVGILQEPFKRVNLTQRHEVENAKYTSSFFFDPSLWAMDLSVKKEVEDCLGSQLGVNTKLEKVLVIPANHGYCFDTIIRPREMMVHPMNRGGSMVNGHDCHLKGGNILLTGLKPSLLAPSSLCMEVHRDPEKRKEQFLRNQNMITQAEHLLGDLHGDEKFLSLGNSHWIMFCRAMEQGAMNI